MHLCQFFTAKTEHEMTYVIGYWKKKQGENLLVQVQYIDFKICI